MQSGERTCPLNVNNLSSWNRALFSKICWLIAFHGSHTAFLLRTVAHLSFENPVFSGCLKFNIPKLRHASESQRLSLLSPGDSTLHHGEIPHHEFLIKS